jgi:hypothetical protein
MKFIIRRILMVSLMLWLPAAGALAAQDAPVPGPYEIQRRIAAKSGFDVAALWRNLGISSELETVYSRVGIVPDEPAVFDHCEDCEAEVRTLRWRGCPAGTVALRIRDRRGFCRFLFFRTVLTGKAPGRSPWRFIGHADHDFSREDPPDCRTETLGGRRYVVMTAQGASGTGVSLAYERRYEIASDRVREVLSLPAKGHECADASSLCRRFAARVVEANRGGNRIRVDFSVEYLGDRFLLDGRTFEEFPLFTLRRRAVYVREGPLRDYVLSPLESEITSEEVRRVHGIGDLACGDFIRLHHGDLERFAAEAGSDEMAWLMRYLSGCEPTPERERLLGFFARQ